MFKAVLFDLDNTLIDFMGTKEICCNAAINAMIDAGLPLKKREAKKKLYQLFDRYGIEYSRIFQEFLKETMKHVDYKILAKGIAAYRKTQVPRLKPYPKTNHVLKELQKKNIKLGVVSDAPKLKAWVRLAETGLIDFFDFVITAEDVGKKKPDSLPFMTAVKKLNLKPTQILFVGDRPLRDIKGSQNVGMKSCLARYGLVGEERKSLQQVKPDYEINSISELLNIACQNNL